MSMHLDIVTPEKKVFSDAVENVYLPGADGEMGILPSHAGLVTALQAGELRYLHNGETGTLAVGSGFAEITQEKVVVLTDMALGEDEIDEEETEKAIERAKEQLHEQEQETYQALKESQAHLAAELAEAADYVISLLPDPLDGEVTTEWKFIPSTQLGGDSFGYHWLDDDNLAMYLLDVCGHGVGAALLSISARTSPALTVSPRRLWMRLTIPAKRGLT